MNARSGYWCESCEEQVVESICDWLDHYRGNGRVEYLAMLFAKRIMRGDWKREHSSNHNDA